MYTTPIAQAIAAQVAAAPDIDAKYAVALPAYEASEKALISDQSPLARATETELLDILTGIAVEEDPQFWAKADATRVHTD
jgi:hypothetical protein